MSGTQGRGVGAEAHPLGDPREGHGFTLQWDEW